MTDQLTYQMPALTDEEITRLKSESLMSLSQLDMCDANLRKSKNQNSAKYWLDEHAIQRHMWNIVLAVITTPAPRPVYFAQDLQDPEKYVRVDKARYDSIVDGCRGKQVYYTTPPSINERLAEILPTPITVKDSAHQSHVDYAEGYNDAIEVMVQRMGVVHLLDHKQPGVMPEDKPNEPT